MKELLIASHNLAKLAEIQAMLAPIHCIGQAELGLKSLAENGLSFVENALVKARHLSSLSQKPVLADDSGLMVNALKGAPGLYSARFAKVQASDTDNIRLLLEKMQPIADDQRQAFFYCALVLVQEPKDPTPIIAYARWSGMIARKAQGNQGFGYDPVFYLPEQKCTAAELPLSLKNTLSHRAKALSALKQQLIELGLMQPQFGVFIHDNHR